MPRFVFATLSVLFALVPAFAQAPDFTKLEQVVADEMKATNSPGAAIAVVRGSEIIYAKGFGVRSVETGEPVGADTLFRLGSTTKMFVAAAVLQLAEQGKLKLDDPIGNHVKNLPEFLRPLTAHELLSHTAGLTDEGSMAGPPEDAALGAGIRAWKEDMRFTGKGKVFSYSNPGYWVAGLLAEEVDGKPFADVMKARLFEPLGMKRTCLRPTEAMTWPLAQGHEVSMGKPVVVRPAADNAATRPAGQIFSSANDLARWTIAFLNGGKLDDKEVLSLSLIEKMSTGHAAISGTKAKYGYGLISATGRGVKVLEHGGSRTGYGSMIRMAPDQKVAVIIIANKTGSTLPKSMEAACELVLPVEKKADPPKSDGKDLTEAEAKKLTGRYTNNRGWVNVFRTDDGKLEVKGVQAAGYYTRANEWTFTGTAGSGRSVTFVAGADGIAEYIMIGTRAMARVSAP